MFSFPLRRWRLLFWTLGLVFLLSGCVSTPAGKTTAMPTPAPLPSPTSVPAPGVALRPLPDTLATLSSFLIFDYQISDPAAIAKRYDFVWGASVYNIAAFRSSNPNIFLTYYLPFHVDWGTFTDNTKRDLAYWQGAHPDWILYQCDRTTPASIDGDVPLDFSNPAFVSWEIETYAKPASQAGYDGIAVDNLVLGNRYHACGVFVNGKWVQLYSGQFDDPRWRANIITWLARMQQALHQFRHPLALIPNIAFDGFPSTSPQIAALVSHIDGISDEGGFTNYGRNGDLTGNDWVQKVQFMGSLQKQNKPYFLVELFPSVGPAEIQWALSSYLMGKGHLGEVYISTPQQYGSAVWHDEYSTQIGTPLGPMYQAQSVYFRNFTRGLSIANPSATVTYVVTLSPVHSYTDLYGNTVDQTVTLGPHTGLVLLNAP